MTDGSQDRLTRSLVARKLAVPRVARQVVRRPRVERLVIDAVTAGALLTVIGAPGSGKSTAVACALADEDRPVAWLSLDGSEGAAGRLLVYLEAAVAPHAPEADGVASDALAAGLPVEEAAGLLAESLHGSGLVLVCDNVERVLPSEPALGVLGALARYAPAGVSLVYLSRQRPALSLNASEVERQAELVDEHLAFTVEEAADALTAAGLQTDPEVAVARAAGWATGVFFGDASAPRRPPGGMRDYLSAQVLGTLPEDEQDLLIRTSVLPEVTREDAEALGLASAGRLIAALRGRHLPMTWSGPGTFAVAPLLRDHLGERLAELDRDDLEQLHRAHAGILVSRGELEEAVDVLLAVGDTDAAWNLAVQVLPTLVDRMDLESAARWLDAFPAAMSDPGPELAICALRVAIGLEQQLRGLSLLDRAGADWLDRIAGTPDGRRDEILVLLTWCVWHVRGPEEAERVAARIGPGRGREIVDVLLSLSRDSTPDDFPEYAATPLGPLEGMLMRIAYTRGRLAGLDDPGTHGPWRSAVGAPWVIAALRATGRLEQAMELYAASEAEASLWLHGLDAADLMMDLGRPDDAWASLRRGWSLQAATGSRVYAALLHLVEARLHLLAGRDPAAALRAAAAARDAGSDSYSFLRELERLWRGVGYLRLGQHETARDLLAEAVAGMQRTDHRLHLVTAATYLAEAQWRTGDEEAADRAAALALATADRVGSTHLLLVALEDVPSVAMRGSDTEQYRDARWHELVGLLARRGRTLAVSQRDPELVLDEFGDPRLLLQGRDVTPNLRKSTVLMARLLSAPDRSVSREDLLSGLFQSRSVPAARSYLRQAVYRLREVLPEPLVPAFVGDDVAIPRADSVVGTSEEVLRTIDLADRQPAEARFATLVEALARADRGEFLAGHAGVWVEARRQEIDERIHRARLDLAHVAFRIDRHWEASLALDAVLRDNPYREEAWLLRIAIAHAGGSDSSVLVVYQRYVSMMRELGVPPSAEVQRYVARLRP